MIDRSDLEGIIANPASIFCRSDRISPSMVSNGVLTSQERPILRPGYTLELPPRSVLGKPGLIWKVLIFPMVRDP